MKILYVLALTLLTIVFTGCYKEVHNTYLNLKDESDIIIYQQDSSTMRLSGTMKTYNDYIFENSNNLRDSNFVELKLYSNHIGGINIKKFYINIWYEKNNCLKLIQNGKVYYGDEYLFEDRCKIINIKDTISNYVTIRDDSYSIIYLAKIKSTPSIEIEKAKYFVSESYIEATLNDSTEIVVQQRDTLYRFPKILRGISVH